MGDTSSSRKPRYHLTLLLICSQYICFSFLLFCVPCGDWFAWAVKRGRLVHTLSSERSKVVAQAFKLKDRSMEELLTPENVDSVISNPPASFVGTIDMLVPSPRCLRKLPDYHLRSPSASDAEADEMDEFSLPRVVQHHNKIGDGPSWSSKRPATAIPVAIPVKKANPSQTPCEANIIDLSPDDSGINSPDNFDTFETEPPVQETPASQSHVLTAPSDTQSPVRMSSVPNASQLLLTIFGTSASDVSSNLLGQGFSSMCKAVFYISLALYNVFALLLSLTRMPGFVAARFHFQGIVPAIASP